MALLTLNAKVYLKLAREPNTATSKQVRFATAAIFESERASKIALSIAAQSSNCTTNGSFEEESKQNVKSCEILTP